MKLIEAATSLPNSVKHVKLRKSLIDLKQKEKNSGEIRRVTVNEIGSDQESSTDLQSSDNDNSIDSCNFSISDDETTDLTSESISLSDASTKKADIKNQKKKVF